ncbi:MAG: hypothetical protein KGH77_03330 [Candidatus Micrarchaeota archaeon]|nr:hypothetical protein [Candidatus Micrarchaeota archaeon]MDE1864433.1 hypothetical protein [Candidatus Micrarchaeota archaeon]
MRIDMLLEYLVFAGAIAQLVTVFPYVRLMLKGRVKPNRVSWLMWSIAPMIATAAGISKGVGWAVLPVFMSGFAPLLILISSFILKNVRWKLSRFDYGCGVLSAFALILWALTSNPNIAIVFAIASDGLAAVPTIMKAWSNPASENMAPFLSGVFSAATAFGAITIWTFSAVAFPAYLVFINLVLISSIYLGKPQKQSGQRKQ